MNSFTSHRGAIACFKVFRLVRKGEYGPILIRLFRMVRGGLIYNVPLVCLRKEISLGWARRSKKRVFKKIDGERGYYKIPPACYFFNTHTTPRGFRRVNPPPSRIIRPRIIHCLTLLRRHIDYPRAWRRQVCLPHRRPYRRGI